MHSALGRPVKTSKGSLETREAEQNGGACSSRDDNAGYILGPNSPTPHSDHTRTLKTTRQHLLTSKQVSAEASERCCAIFLHRISEAPRAYPFTSFFFFFFADNHDFPLPSSMFMFRCVSSQQRATFLSTMSITLPELPWAKDSLAPHISSEVSMYSCIALWWQCSHWSAKQGQHERAFCAANPRKPV